VLYRIVPLSMTLNDPEAHFQCHSLKANISQTVHLIHSMFGSRLGVSGTADLKVQLSNVKNPRWRLTAILDVQKWPSSRSRFADRRDVWFYGRFPTELNFYHKGLHTCTAVARNPCVSWALLVRITVFYYCNAKPPWPFPNTDARHDQTPKQHQLSLTDCRVDGTAEIHGPGESPRRRLGAWVQRLSSVTVLHEQCFHGFFQGGDVTHVT